MTDTRKEILAEIIKVQNHPANCNQDIVTFTGFMDEVEMLNHLARYREYAENFDKKKAA
jgi:hypothetical protein